MKKQIIVGLMVFLAYNSFAQNKKMLGNWKEVYITQIDTSYDGREELNSDPKSYKDRTKVLSHEYISLAKIFPDDLHGNYTIKIIQDLGFFWLAWGYESDFAKKIIYDPKKNSFVITKVTSAQGDLAIEYDEKNDHLLLFDKETRIPWYEFSRK